MTTGRINQVTAVHAAPAPRLHRRGRAERPWGRPAAEGTGRTRAKHAAHRNRTQPCKSSKNPRTRGTGRDHARPEAARAVSTAPGAVDPHATTAPDTHARTPRATAQPTPQTPSSAAGRRRDRGEHAPPICPHPRYEPTRSAGGERRAVEQPCGHPTPTRGGSTQHACHTPTLPPDDSCQSRRLLPKQLSSSK